ncbi:MAG: hypothetical protein WBA77_14430 [Microcoleaceae cyanobacterium]
MTLSTISEGSVYLLPDFLFRETIASKLTVAGEQSFPALYSSLALFFCSCLLWIITQYKKKLRDKYILSWKTLSYIFCYLALDELLSFHETLTIPFQKLGFDGILHYAWVVPGIIGVVIFCLAFYRFFQHLPRYMKRLLLLAFSIFIGGAIFTEILGGYYQYLYGRENLTYFLIATVEESMEMIGILIFIHALLTYIEKIGINKVNFLLNVSQSSSTNYQLK